jgi:hypothetical protein
VSLFGVDNFIGAAISLRVARSAGSTRNATRHACSRIAPLRRLNSMAVKTRLFPEADVRGLCSGTPRSRCHFAAFFGATLTCLRTVLAMLRVVFCAFLAARFTNFSADAADRGGKLRTARHQACCSRADRGAGAIQLDATRHHLYVLLLQAFRRAIFASNHAVSTSVNTALIFFVWHTHLSNALACSFSFGKHLE